MRRGTARDLHFPAAQSDMAAWLQSERISRYAVLNPGAGWASRRWPAERYGAVAHQLAARASLPSVVAWAGDEERTEATNIVAQSQGAARLAPATSLPQLAELLRGARLMVSSDTGPLHLAVAVGTQCVALHGPTLPSKSGPYGPGHVAVQQYYQAGSSRARRTASNAAMQAIAPQQVFEACTALLNQSPAAHTGQSNNRRSSAA